MHLADLQKAIADALNADPALRAGGVAVFPEDRGDVGAEVARRLQESGEVAGIVSTPDADSLGGDAVRGIMLKVSTLAVAFHEIPALNRERPGHLTALQAAQRAALVLHGETVHLDGIRQTADAPDGTTVILTATDTFHTSLTLKEEPEEQGEA